jgi:hypothetical protein
VQRARRCSESGRLWRCMLASRKQTERAAGACTGRTGRGVRNEHSAQPEPRRVPGCGGWRGRRPEPLIALPGLPVADVQEAAAWALGILSADDGIGRTIAAAGGNSAIHRSASICLRPGLCTSS